MRRGAWCKRYRGRVRPGAADICGRYPYWAGTLVSMQVAQSQKLADVCYDIRGPVLQEAQRLEEEGHRVLKLNIGNPAPFGFDAPEDILRDVILNLPVSQGYSDSKGLLSARRAVVQYAELKKLPDVHV